MKKEQKWKQTLIDLGSIKEKKKVKFNFESLVPLDILKAKPGCANCTTIGKYENNLLPITFKPGSISKHLKNSIGYQDFRKSVILYYKDGTKEILKFKGRIL